jgi:hypothetical protein
MALYSSTLNIARDTNVYFYNNTRDMSPKKPKPATCDLCCKQIQEGKEEALHCEGGCGLWFHRYCAGVSVSLFKELAGSPEPFLCYICYQRSQLAVTKELRNEVAHLKSEITKLSEQLTIAKLSCAGSAKDLTCVLHFLQHCIALGKTLARIRNIG